VKKQGRIKQFSTQLHPTYLWCGKICIGWGCILNCFMLSSLPCFYAFCWSAIPISCYIFNIFYSCIYMCGNSWWYSGCHTQSGIQLPIKVKACMRAHPASTQVHVGSWHVRFLDASSSFICLMEGAWVAWDVCLAFTACTCRARAATCGAKHLTSLHCSSTAAPLHTTDDKKLVRAWKWG